MTPLQLRAEIDTVAKQLDALADQLNPRQQGAVRHLASLARDVARDQSLNDVPVTLRMGSVRNIAHLLSRLPPDAPLLLRRADGHLDLGFIRVESAEPDAPGSGWVISSQIGTGRPVMVVE